MDRSITPLIKDAVEFELKLKPYQQFTLANGVNVFAIDAGAQDVLQVELVLMRAIILKKLKALLAQQTPY